MRKDVLSFGVVLLELIITGKKPGGGEFGDSMVDNVQWVKKMTASVEGVVDPRLSSFSLHEVMHLFSLVVSCVEQKPVEWPTTLQVVQIPIELPNANPVLNNTSIATN